MIKMSRLWETSDTEVSEQAPRKPLSRRNKVLAAVGVVAVLGIGGGLMAVTSGSAPAPKPANPLCTSQSLAGLNSYWDEQIAIAGTTGTQSQVQQATDDAQVALAQRAAICDITWTTGGGWTSNK